MNGRISLAIAAVALLAIAAFCGFGFLASFEYAGITGWKIGYGTATTLAVAGAALCVWRAARKPG